MTRKRPNTISVRISDDLQKRAAERDSISRSAFVRRCLEHYADGETADEAARKAIVMDSLKDALDRTDEFEAELIATVREECDEHRRRLEAVLDELDERPDDGTQTVELDGDDDRQTVLDLLESLDERVDMHGQPVTDELRLIGDLASVLGLSSAETHARYRASRPDVPDLGFTGPRETRGTWKSLPSQYTDEPHLSDGERLEIVCGGRQ